MKAEGLQSGLREKQIKNIIGSLLLAVSFLLLSRLFFFCFSADIWYDEVFSIKMLDGSYQEITAFTAKDVHPPFYYWYVKTFVLAGGWITGMTDRAGMVILAKLASLLPMAGLWFLALTKIRRQLGLFVAGAFSFCVMTMPQLTAYGIEIRMYSLALFLVTLAFLFACEIIRKRSEASFIGLCICGILTAYTQYFSCLGIAFLYLLLGWLIRQDRAAIKKWLLCILISVLAYLPWMGTLIRQFTAVKGSYWIEPLTWKSFAGCIKYIYLPSGGYPWLNYLLAVLLILATLILAVVFGIKQWRKGGLFLEEGVLLFLGWGTLAGVVLTGVGVSILVSPVFVYRYMIPFLGSFWLVFALLLDRAGKKGLWIPVCLLVLFIGYTNVKGVFWEEAYKQTHMEDTLQGLEKIKEEDILIFNFNHVQAVVGYYLDNESCLLYQEAEELMKEVYPQFGMLEEEAELKRLFESGGTGEIWFLGSFNSREEIVEKWRSMGFQVTEEGSYLLERYWFNLYRIEEGK